MLPPIDELMAMTSRQLDALKAREVEALLNSVDNVGRTQRLATLQWTIEDEIYTAPNKLSAALKIKSMMNESLIDLAVKLNTATGAKPHVTESNN